VIGLCVLSAVLFLISHLGGSDGVPSGTPPVVIVTVLDQDNYSKAYIDNIKENRIEYARKHGRRELFETQLSMLTNISI